MRAARNIQIACAGAAVHLAAQVQILGMCGIDDANVRALMGTGIDESIVVRMVG